MPKYITSKKQNRKQVESSSDSESSTSESDSEEEEFDLDFSDSDEPKNSKGKDKMGKDEKLKYTKFISKMFPSKYMSKKVKDQETIEKVSKNKQDDKPVSKRDTGKSPKKKVQESSSDSDTESDSDSEYVPESTSSESEKKNKSNSKSANVNIILTVDNSNDDEDFDEDDEWEDDSEETESEEEDEDVSVSSDDSDDEEEEEDVSESSNEDKKGSYEKDKLLSALLELQSQNKDNKMIKECINTCKAKIRQYTKRQEKKETKQKEKNRRIFKKMLLNRKMLNEQVFFKKMTIDEQKRIIKELRAINKIISVEKPYRLSLLESNIPIQYKSAAMKKINLLKSMDQYCSEYHKVKHWVDTFMTIPFGVYHKLDVSMKDGVETSHAFMENAKTILDSAVYGLNDAKIQIMQMLGQLVTNPHAVGCAIAIKGPMGTGKTTLVKEGISKILNRPFAFIALGGATDSSFLEGHSYTYEGSIWGKIVQIIIDSKCMNPVIYFDELDKISDTPKGEEIAGILTHLTDTSQNSQFHDKYFTEIDFDLSKCMFIFSYNDESKVNPILRDRMYRIQTKGYDKKQKTIIANQYILPKIREQVKFETSDIVISDDVIHHIIENYCEKEDGVRNQKRCLEIIYTKLNLYRLMRPGSNLFEQELSIQVSFPFQVTKQIVDKLIKTNRDDKFDARSLYV